jgi:hypothetical protein
VAAATAVEVSLGSSEFFCVLFLVVRFSDCFVFAQMAAAVGAEAVGDTVVAAEAAGGMEVAAVAGGTVAVVGEAAVEEEATVAAVEAAGEVAAAGEDAKATGFALTRGAYRFLPLPLWDLDVYTRDRSTLA